MASGALGAGEGPPAHSQALVQRSINREPPLYRQGQWWREFEEGRRVDVRRLPLAGLRPKALSLNSAQCGLQLEQ